MTVRLTLRPLHAAWRFLPAAVLLLAGCGSDPPAPPPPPAPPGQQASDDDPASPADDPADPTAPDSAADGLGPNGPRTVTIGPSFENLGSAAEEPQPLPPADRVAEAEELGIELTPLVRWNGRQAAGPRYPWLDLGVTMTGGAAAAAWQYGHLECRCLLDAEGTELAVEQQRYRDDMHLATRESELVDGVEAVVCFSRPYPLPESIYAVEGSLRLLIGGEETTIKIENVTSHAGVYSNPELEAAGIDKIEIQYEPFHQADHPHARISVITPQAAISGISVRDVNGNERERIPIALGFSPTSYTYGFILQDIPAEDDQLWIQVVSGAEEVEVPFRFENVELPEMP